MSANIYSPPFVYPPEVDPSTNPPAVAPGTIVLFKDNVWDPSNSLTINTTDGSYPENLPFSFSGTPLQDAATWIAFNLPVGVVCTLFNNLVNDPKNPVNFSGAGICVDLIGTGRLQTVDLLSYNYNPTGLFPISGNDCLSGGVWRQVDLNGGWFQLFTGQNCQGPFMTFFLSEWPSSGTTTSKSPTFNSIDGTFIQDSSNSVNIPCLTPVQILTLYDNIDGAGQNAAFGARNPFGTWTTVAQINLSDSGMANKVSAFSYATIQPVSANITNVTFDVSGQYDPSTESQESATFTNKSAASIEQTWTVAQGMTTTMSSTVSTEFTQAIQISAEYTSTAGVEGVSSQSYKVGASFTATFEEDQSKTWTTETTNTMQQTVEVEVPPHSVVNAIASISVCNAPTMTKTTTGTFYYKQQLQGSTYDPNTQCYVLTNPVTVSIQGGVGSVVDISTN